MTWRNSYGDGEGVVEMGPWLKRGYQNLKCIHSKLILTNIHV